MTITKREILFCVIIIVIMILCGIFISNAIEKSHLETAEMYYKSLKIDNDAKMFDYNIKTNGGNTLAYGNAKVIDPVSVPEINGDYAVITKYTEMYQKHVDYVTKEDDEGNTYTEEVITYSWDQVDTERLKSKSVSFLGHTFSSDIFDLGSGSRLDLEKNVSPQFKDLYHWGYLYKDSDWFESVGDIRWYYTVVPTEFTGSLFANFVGEDISVKNSVFYKDQTISQVIELKETAGTVGKVLFWVLWIMFSGFAVFMFYYAENHWLEDKRRY